MQRFETDCGSVLEVADLFSHNQSYPRGVLHDGLYVDLATTYMDACPAEHHTGAVLFSQAIEALHAANRVLEGERHCETSKSQPPS